MRMLQLLTTSSSIHVAYDLLQNEYEVEPEKLRQDLDELLSKLVEQGLVEVSNE